MLFLTFLINPYAKIIEKISTIIETISITFNAIFSSCSAFKAEASTNAIT